MKPLLTLAVCIAAQIASGSASAKVSAEEASRLGRDLTVMGAEAAGNADGSIPAFSGKLPPFPPEVYQQPGKHLPNPYANEKPLFEITAQNYTQYAKHLSDGQIAQFKHYPKTYKVVVYPTHRDAVFSEQAQKNTIANATRTELVEGGNGFINGIGGTPFPIPKDGQEAIWNQLVRVSTYYYDITYDGAAVYKDGQVGFQRTRTRTLLPFFKPNGTLEDFNQMLGYQMVEWLEPERKRGEIILVHEAVNQVKFPRDAWMYSPGTRRVKRAPVVAYDNPAGPGDLQTVDDGRMFNGAIDRYDWKLVGKQEMFIPYHNYDADNPKLKYSELLTPFHINPNYIRYEKHRVWVVEATLKQGARHLYGKRRFYLDEDSWHVVLADNFDNRGQLWRTSMQTQIVHPLMPGAYSRLWIVSDLQSGAYAADRLVNQLPQAERFDLKPEPLENFTPNAIRINTRR